MATEGGHTASFLKISLMCRGIDLVAQTEGLIVTLIDFTLSRLRTAEGDVAYSDLNADPELFQGPKRDCQVQALLPAGVPFIYVV